MSNITLEFVEDIQLTLPIVRAIRGDTGPIDTSAIEAHENATNPHPQYALISALGTAAATDSSDYATAAQGEKADTALQSSDIGTTTGTVAAGDDSRFTDARPPTGGAGGVLSGNYPNPGFAVDMATQGELDAVAAAKVDKVAGKGLSTEDYSTAEKGKLAGIADGATANATDAQLRDRTTHTGAQAISTVTGLQGALDAKAPLASPALTGVPSAPTAAAGTNTTQLATTAFAKAQIAADAAPIAHVGSGGAAHANAVASGAAGFMTGADKTKLDGIAAGATANSTDAQLRDRATHTGAQAISTVTGLQGALDAKEAAGTAATAVSSHVAAGDPHPQYTTAAEAAAAAPVQSVAGRAGAVTLAKADVGLGNVDNTSDANKPVSTAQQTALNLKANIASPTFTGTVNGITKSMVGLGNVDNTSDASKPVSTAQAAAIATATAIHPFLLIGA